MQLLLNWILHFDRTLFTLINSVWTAPWMDAFFPFITDLHKTLWFKVIVVPIVCCLFIWRRGFKKGLIIFIFALASIFISDGIGSHFFKNTVQRPRPASDTEIHAIVRSPFGGFSFVSNHAANNFAFAVFVSSFFPTASLLFYAIALTVCYSRIYDGVHYPTDVICGALVGVSVALIMISLCRWVLRKMNSAEVST